MATTMMTSIWRWNVVMPWSSQWDGSRDLALMITTNIHPRQTSPLTWKIQPPTQRVVHEAPQHKTNKAKGSGNQHNQPQQLSKVHPSFTSNRVSTGGYTQKPPTGNHHHSLYIIYITSRYGQHHARWLSSTPSAQRHVAKVRQKKTTQLRTGQSKWRWCDVLC